MKLLIAEDSAPALEAFVRMATAWGYDVVAVSDGAAAWRSLQEADAPKMALLDWIMPTMDGIEVCRRVKQHSFHHAPYLILITGMDGEDDLVAALGSGAQEYIRKPVSPAELRARLDVGRGVVELQMSLADRVHKLERALQEVNQLHGLLPICSYCKKIRDDQNYWRQVEEYISAKSDAQFSHSICPGCFESIVEPELRELTDSIPSPPGAPVAVINGRHGKQAPPKHELRKSERYLCDWKTSSSLQTDMGTAFIRDVSAEGIQLELSRAIEPGSTFCIKLLDRRGHLHNVNSVRAVHTTPHGASRWIVGSSFSRRLSAEELGAVLRLEESTSARSG